MKKYIDFDGVILDTSPLLFQQWNKIKHDGLTEDDKIAYVKTQNWTVILDNSPEINDSLYILKQLDIEQNTILTTIHSLENEGVAKVKYLRKNGILLPIILVPYLVDKTQMVSSKNNILVDDRVYNLDMWELSGGHGVFFNKNHENIDEWHQENVHYPKIRTLNNLDKIKIKNRK